MTSTTRLINAANQQQQLTALVWGFSPMMALQPGAGIMTPTHAGLNTRLEQFVLQQEQDGKPGNTAKAFDPKGTECQQFYEYRNPLAVHKYHLDCDKVHKFMFCQAFCNKQKRGKNNKNGIYFDTEAYHEVMVVFLQATAENGQLVRCPTPKHPMVADTFNQNKAVPKLMHQHKVVARTTGVTEPIF
jgi:hypothetical protein